MGRWAAGALLGWMAPASLCVPLLAAQSNPTPSTNPVPAAASVPALTVAAGQRLVLELEDSLHTRHNRKGDRAHFTTVNETLVGSQVALPAGTEVRARLTKVKKPGRAGSAGRIRLQFDEILLPDGARLPLEAKLVRAGFFDVSKSGKGVQGEGRKSDLANVGVLAAEGALLGVLIDRSAQGAAYGSAVGAGIGLVSVLLRRGPHLDLPRGTLFEIELNKPLAVPLASAVQFAQRGPLSPPGSSVGSAGPLSPSVPSDSSDSRDSATSASETIPDFKEDTATVALSRQPPPAPPPFDPSIIDPDAYRMRVDVPLVLVEAYVRDQRGGPLDNLTREDFRLWEDGVEQRVSHFSRDQLPLAVALVVDHSGSVAPYMPELRHAAYQTLSQLKPGDQVCLFAFDSDVERLEDLTTDRRRIAERIARIHAGGGTNITDALFAAAQYLSAAAPDRRRAIILISDNQATVRGHASQERVIRLALEAGVVIYSIKTPGEPTPLMWRLPTWLSGTGSVGTMTRETGGEIIDVDEVGSLQAALAAVVSRLKTRYTLGYHSTNKAKDGSLRKIEVRLADRFGRPGLDYTLHARSGYYAPREQVASQSPPPAR